jgi:hypothetical protein
MAKSRTTKVLVGGALATVLVFSGALPAMAASGDYNCGSGTRVTQMTSDTTGTTKHAWTDNATAAQKSSTFAGGLNRSQGYRNSHWVLTASSVISNSITCA